MRDGVPYDLNYRTKLARQAIKEAKPKHVRKVARPPGPNGKKIIFNTATRRQTMAEVMAEIPRDFPRIAFTTLAGEPVYILTHPETILQVFQTHGKDTMKGRGLQLAMSVIGEGLLTSEGQTHLRQRRMIQPAFHRKRIESYAQSMVELSVAHEQAWVDGQAIDVVADMSALTLAIVGRALFGSDLASDAREVGEALTEVLENFQRQMLPGMQQFNRLPLPRNKRLHAQAERLDELVQRLIVEHREAGDNGDLLSMMIEAQDEGSTMDDAQLRDEAMTLVLAGHETTAMALSWTWYLLAGNPEVARKLRAELDDVLNGEAPSFQDMGRLPYTSAVIAESMRLYPPAWIIGRRTLADQEVDGWEIPAGSITLASAYAMHRDPRFWDSSLAFKPERWITDEGGYSETAPGQPRGAWFPFGFSNRRCIGDQFALTEGVLVLATLASRWELSLEPGSRVRGTPAVTLRPAGEYRMRVRRR